ERVVDLVTQYAHEPLPCLQFLFAQRLADVGEHQQRVRAAILTEGSAPDLPPSGSSGECDIHSSRRCALERIVEPHLFRRSTEQTLGGLREESLARAIYQPNAILVVERKDGDVNLAHHGAEQRGRFHGAEALCAQRLAEQVRLEERET